MEKLYKVFENESQRIYSILNSDNKIVYYYEGFNSEEKVKNTITSIIIALYLRGKDPSDPIYFIAEEQAKAHAELLLAQSVLCKIAGSDL